LEDLLDGKITADYARSQYGVVVDTAPGKIDATATADLRANCKAAEGDHLGYFHRSLAALIDAPVPKGAAE
jgi:hypothetical protein